MNGSPMRCEPRPGHSLWPTRTSALPTRTAASRPSRATGRCVWNPSAGIRCEGYGKPFVPAFELALSRLGRAADRRDRIAMVGDGLYTDILGGLAAGLGTVLVTSYGLLKDLDWRAWVARTGISPRLRDSRTVGRIDDTYPVQRSGPR